MYASNTQYLFLQITVFILVKSTLHHHLRA
jgi:hypothetical protein